MDRHGRGRWWTPLGVALLCTHCTIGAGLVAVSAFGLFTLPTVGSLDLAWVLPPVLILGGFGAWVWSGRFAASRDAACAITEDESR